MSQYLVFDLETQKLFEEVAGRENFQDLRLAVAVLYDSATDQYQSYTEDKVQELIAALRRAPLVVGFNLLGFDYQVLAAYTEQPFSDIPTLDMHREVERQLGFRLGLDALASATLGLEKSASGLLAVRWFKAGRLDLVIEYCRRDVEITKALYEYGRDHGQVFFWDKARGVRKPIPVSWPR